MFVGGLSQSVNQSCSRPKGDFSIFGGRGAWPPCFPLDPPLYVWLTFTCATSRCLQYQYVGYFLLIGFFIYEISFTCFYTHLTVCCDRAHCMQCLDMAGSRDFKREITLNCCLGLQLTLNKCVLCVGCYNSMNFMQISSWLWKVIRIRTPGLPDFRSGLWIQTSYAFGWGLCSPGDRVSGIKRSCFLHTG